MKWKTPKKKQIKEGDERVVRRFLLFPLAIREQTRWLEWAYIRERAYLGHSFCLGDPPGMMVIKWAEIDFLPNIRSSATPEKPL